MIDRDKRMIVTTWRVPEGQFCVAADLDEADKQFFITCRSGTLNVLDAQTGKAIVALPIAKGTDDVFYDPQRKRIYVTSAEGLIEVFHQRDRDHYDLIGKLPTGPMAKNLLLVNSLNRLYVAVPPTGKAEAKILVYAIQ